MAAQKTNVMRVLEQKKIAYTPHEYPHGDERASRGWTRHACSKRL